MFRIVPPFAPALVPLGMLLACSDQGFGTRASTDTFVQPDNHIAADVLFVVDNSASMGEEQVRLAENFLAFVDVLASTVADYQLGVVTTDVSDGSAGVLRGGVMTPDMANLADVFRAAVLAGTSGSRDEQGFAAGVLAADPARNPGFLRTGARFNLVFISDEDDQSPGDVADYLALYGESAGEPGFAAHALVGDLPQGCASGALAASPGPRYLDAAEGSAGFVESICAENYSGLLTRVGLDVSGWEDTFPLSRLPSVDTLEVRVNDVLIPERELDGWQYSVGDNAIVFSGRAIPRPGMGIEVVYTAWNGAGTSQ